MWCLDGALTGRFTIFPRDACYKSNDQLGNYYRREGVGIIRKIGTCSLVICSYKAIAWNLSMLFLLLLKFHFGLFFLPKLII